MKCSFEYVKRPFELGKCYLIIFTAYFQFVFMLTNNLPKISFIVALFFVSLVDAQVVINEGSNRNFNSYLDENGDAEDWVELYNSGSTAVNLEGMSLSDDPLNPSMWTFPNYFMQPGEYLVVFCSDKNRFFEPPFQQVAFNEQYQPIEGWNVHNFEEPFLWDGVSDIVINSCSYYDQGYTVNSVFNQNNPGFPCSIVRVNDGSDASCSSPNGDSYNIRPNIQLNGITIGNGNIENGNTEYPAPYGNWYWSARNQSLYRGTELQAAGLTAGPISTLAWDVESEESIAYTYVDISIKQLTLSQMSNLFINDNGAFFHTNFKIDSQGETVYLFDQNNSLISEALIDCQDYSLSKGFSTDGEGNFGILYPPTPGFSNASSSTPLGQLLSPAFSTQAGVYPGVQNVQLFDLNTLPNVEVHYTLDGSDPTLDSQLYTGETIPVFMSMAIRAKAFLDGYIPSETNSASYLINVNHATPIMAVVIDGASLYGDEGIFTNWEQDWEKFAQVTYFDSTSTHPMLFERNVAMQIDGGAGGSRSNPQHSFRLELAKGALGESPVEMPLLPNRPMRDIYSKLYFRNGSNQWLTLPYKDACLVEMMTAETNGYFSAMRPVTVYINGVYFGLYEMREKLDEEFYKVYDNYDSNDIDLLTLSYWYGGQLRATAGDVQNYWDTWSTVSNINVNASDYLEQVEQYYDMEYYTDYIIGESWVGNTDWPYNNIKVYRSDSTDYKWRFSTIDLELSLAPNGWSDCNFNGLEHVLNNTADDPYTGLWVRAIGDINYRNYFINRYADILNTSYRLDRLVTMENNYFNRWALEMPNEYQLWGDPWNVGGMMIDFYQRHLELQNDLMCKTETVRDQIQNVFQLPFQGNVTLSVEPSDAGLITINTITPTDLPWDGIYFQNVPINLQTTPNENYEFSHWEIDGVQFNAGNPFINSYFIDNQVNFVAVYNTLIGVDEVSMAKSSLHIYPNPASEVLMIQNDERRMSEYAIFSLDGKMISREVLTLSQNNVVVNLSTINQGLYYALIKYLDGSTETVKFIKE